MRSDSYLVPGLIVVLGVAGAIGAVWALSGSDVTVTETGTSTNNSGDGDRPAISPDGPHPRVVIDEPMFEFGAMQLGESRTRDFEIRNEGEGDLVIKKGPTTCQCTIADLDGDVIPPGGATKITLTWEPNHATDHFDKGGKFYTNDPNLREFSLHVMGKVTSLFKTTPEGDWEAGTVDVTRGTSVSGSFYSEVTEFGIEGVTADKDWISVEYTPMSQEKLDEVTALSGYDVTVTFDPLKADSVGEDAGDEDNGDENSTEDVQIGDFTERIEFQLSGANQETWSVNVTGTREGPVSIRPIVGARFYPDSRLLDLGRIKPATEATAKLLMRVEGYEDDFDITSIDFPDEILKVDVELQSEQKLKKIRTYQITVHVPKDHKRVSYVQRDPAEIEIRMQHPHPVGRVVTIRVTLTTL